ncbi:hypothetical protein SeLEV6574_g03916 [Synchytrium endobioticum]|nr:hypothetical protein SeLEV6574_g03916 [Synchytrium endobioticum]
MSSNKRKILPEAHETRDTKRGRYTGPPPPQTANSNQHHKQNPNYQSHSEYKNQQHHNHHRPPVLDSVAPLVASHYNARPDAGQAVRHQSPIIGLRHFNNWCKATLIQEFTKKARATICHPGGDRTRGLRVLDMCCGKGGDFGKWAKANVDDLVGIDIAAVSIEDAKSRYEEGRTRRGPAAFRFRASFFAQNCFTQPLSDSLGPNPPPFDLVSTQFALHYSFENEVSARQALKNISGALRTGGYFIGTLPDAYWIVKRLKSEAGLSFGNSLYRITFEHRDSFPTFGHKYWFLLEDAINNAPEFLVHFPTLKRLAAEYGLNLVYKKRLHDFYVERSSEGDDGALLKKMLGTKIVTANEWEAIGIYLAFAFQKL